MIKCTAEGGGAWLQPYTSQGLYFRFYCALQQKSYVLPKVTTVIIGGSSVKDLGQDSLSSVCSPEDSQESVPQSSVLNDFPMNVPFN